jgi:DNA adenine methylase
MTAKIVPLLPKHETYVEPFFGGGSIFFAKRPAKVETINDLNEGVSNLYQVLRDHGDDFLKLAELTEYGKKLYKECVSTWQDEKDPVRKAWRWWVVASMSFGGIFAGSFGTAVNSSTGHIGTACASFIGRVRNLPNVIRRLQRTQIENVDALRVLEQYCTENGLAYIDPPYVSETRRAGHYDHEMTDRDHKKLVSAILDLPGRFVVSGYAHPIYERLSEAGWKRMDFETTCSAVGRTRVSGLQGSGNVLEKQRRTESVWLDPQTAEDVDGSVITVDGIRFERDGFWKL